MFLSNQCHGMTNTVVDFRILPHQGKVVLQLLGVFVLESFSFHHHVPESYGPKNSVLVIRKFFRSWHMVKKVWVNGPSIVELDLVNKQLKYGVKLGITLALASTLTSLLRSIVFKIVFKRTN